MSATVARYLNVALRTIHVAAFGLLLGGHAWEVAPERLVGVLGVTLASGLGLAALECREGLGWLLEGRGLMVVAKLGVLLAVPFAWEHRFAVLMAVVVVASVGAHVPRTFRHASVGPLLMAVRARLTRTGSMGDIARLTGVVATVLALALAPRLAGGEPLGPLPALKIPKADQAELGRLLFFDPRLSGDAALACATCHDPKKGWADGKPLSTGYPGSEYFRNTQTLLNAAYYRRNYWDGRLDGRDLPTLVRDHLTEAHFMQVDGRLFAERLKQAPDYDEMFRKVMGGEPSFGRTLNALAAFMQTLSSRNAPFDRHLKGETSALSAPAQEGMRLFQGKAPTFTRTVRTCIFDWSSINGRTGLALPTVDYEVFTAIEPPLPIARYALDGKAVSPAAIERLDATAAEAVLAGSVAAHTNVKIVLGPAAAPAPLGVSAGILPSAAVVVRTAGSRQAGLCGSHLG